MNDDSIHIGFTGTRKGLTIHQRDKLIRYIYPFHLQLPWLRMQYGGYFVYFHHGDCVGADAEAHGIALKYGFRVVIHPPKDPKLRAYCGYAWHTERALPYLERNRAIVDGCSRMIACPATSHHILRSGTWSTIRYARKRPHVDELVLIAP